MPTTAYRTPSIVTPPEPSSPGGPRQASAPGALLCRSLAYPARKSHVTPSEMTTSTPARLAECADERKRRLSPVLARRLLGGGAAGLQEGRTDGREGVDGLGGEAEARGGGGAVGEGVVDERIGGIDVLEG